MFPHAHSCRRSGRRVTPRGATGNKRSVAGEEEVNQGCGGRGKFWRGSARRRTAPDYVSYAHTCRRNTPTLPGPYHTGVVRYIVIFIPLRSITAIQSAHTPQYNPSPPAREVICREAVFYETGLDVVYAHAYGGVRNVRVCGACHGCAHVPACAHMYDPHFLPAVHTPFADTLHRASVG